MRESIGGTLLLKIVLVFLAVYIGFIAIVINYGKIFRFKNTIINRIEQNEGYRVCTDVHAMVRSIGYNGKYTISSATNARGVIYKATIYISFNLPLVKNKVEIPISGETRLIDTGYEDLEDMTCTQSDY